MKRFFYIAVFLIFATCDSENAPDCFQTTGRIISENREVAEFSRILVNTGITMIIQQDAETSVVVETGENLINDVEVEVIDGRLILTDNNDCNFVRDFGTTTIRVTTPDITEIRSSTQFDIRSEGVLRFPNLRIISEDVNEDAQSVGNFYLTIENQSFVVVFNNLSNAFIDGSTTNLNVSFFSGNSRFEGENLEASDITVFHRGTNDMLLFPTNSISGDLFSSGDVIIFNDPDEVDVTEHYKGRLIFRN
ncbi:head GIN domain-containing protein [Leptobacterium flavescens]|uniref:head GIN domain-containing protein n=1 Tax=Leptobacterium flavescens TaxID=472055 RepID=UPI00293BC5EE|nr:head GIN domain-containing protein [Leptobacterium flavescens]